MTIKIVNGHFHKSDGTEIKIDRSSVLGNPYTHLKGKTKAKFLVSTREEAIAKYRQWLYNKLKNGDAEILAELEKIKPDSIILCWCVKNDGSVRCHGEIIKSLLEKFTIEEIKNWSKNKQ